MFINRVPQKKKIGTGQKQHFGTY